MKQRVKRSSTFRTRALISDPHHMISHRRLLKMAGIRPSESRLRTVELPNGRIIIEDSSDIDCSSKEKYPDDVDTYSADD